MNQPVTILPKTLVSGTIEHLPSSKSLSNRALILNALAGGKATLQNLSEANDTALMQRLLHTPGDVIDVEDAGTVMRFLTAYFAVTNQVKKITGSTRMQKRPIRELVDALRTLGAVIVYEAEEGYPPLRLRGFSGQRTDDLSIRGDISSQFISAIMMVAPTLPKGLTLRLTGRIGSRPYLDMTAKLMQYFGIAVEWEFNTIYIPSGSYRPVAYWVEPDWSAASYWFSFAALAQAADIFIPRVTPDSLQGDRIIADIMEQLGVRAIFTKAGLRLAKGGKHAERLSVDFSGCPDLAQTVLPACAALQVPGEFKGLESLRIKETDRITALTNELSKIGASLSEVNGKWTLRPGKPGDMPSTLKIQTYGDHRMAMGFAPLATKTNLVIEDAQVVRKSYPDFWKDVAGIGFFTSD